MDNKKQFLKDILLVVISSIISVAIFLVAINNGYIKIPNDSKNTAQTDSIAIHVINKARLATVSVFCNYNYANSSCGSGVIVEYDSIENVAYVITNHHVIEGVKENRIEIFSLLDGWRKDVTLIGTDPECDIAVLAFTPTKTPMVAEIGRSADELNIGENVFAIGSPAGLNDTATRGIISQNMRSLTVNGIEKFYVQTDTAINPGNSGGGLFDSNGKLIAINDLGLNGYEQLNLCIPILYDKLTPKTNTAYNANKADAITSYNCLMESHKSLVAENAINTVGFISGQKTVGAFFDNISIENENLLNHYCYVEEVIDNITPTSPDRFLEIREDPSDSNIVYLDCITHINGVAVPKVLTENADSPAVFIYKEINKLSIGSTVTFTVKENYINYNENKFHEVASSKTVVVVLSQYHYQLPV